MRQFLRLQLMLSVFVLSLLGATASASAWAPEGSATIHPGVMTFTNASSFLNGASQCTANFVFTDSSGAVYLGQAAHCSSTGEDTETNGCTTKSLPLGTSIYSGDLVNGGVQDGTLIGTLAYNSWIAMQKAKEKDANTCAYNDLALIKISPSQAINVNPTVPFWGGPNGLAPGVSPTGEQVFSYGNSILRLGVSAQPEDRREPRRPGRKRRLESAALHGHAGHSRRLRQRLHGRQRQRARRALDGRVRPAAGRQRRGHARARSSPTPTARPALA